MAKSIFLICMLGFVFTCVKADPATLQDFCVAQPNSGVFLNGLACKDPKTVQPDDFFFQGLDAPPAKFDALGGGYTFVTAAEVPGLNTLGISLIRADYKPSGITPPHVHPRATEIVTVLEGSIEAGFVTTFPDNRLFSKVLQKGDVFVVPPGLIHIIRNTGNSSAIVLAAWNSQDPGVSPVPSAVFGSNPAISVDLLAKAFLVDQSIASQIQSKFQKKP